MDSCSPNGTTPRLSRSPAHRRPMSTGKPHPVELRAEVRIPRKRTPSGHPLATRTPRFPPARAAPMRWSSAPAPRQPLSASGYFLASPPRTPMIALGGRSRPSWSRRASSARPCRTARTASSRNSSMKPLAMIRNAGTPERKTTTARGPPGQAIALQWPQPRKAGNCPDAASPSRPGLHPLERVIPQPHENKLVRVSTHSRLAPAEQAVLGRLMLEPSTWTEAGGLGPADLADDRHRLIFDVIAELARAGLPTNAVTVFAALDDAGQAGRAGGASYLAEIVGANSPGAASPATRRSSARRPAPDGHIQRRDQRRRQ